MRANKCHLVSFYLKISSLKKADFTAAEIKIFISCYRLRFPKGVVVVLKCYEIRQTDSAAATAQEAIMPAEKRRKGCLGAVILLIAVGLTGRVSAWNNGRLKDGREISAAQRYFDAVSPEGKCKML